MNAYEWTLMNERSQACFLDFCNFSFFATSRMEQLGLRLATAIIRLWSFTQCGTLFLSLTFFRSTIKRSRETFYDTRHCRLANFQHLFDGSVRKKCVAEVCVQNDLAHLLFYTHTSSSIEWHDFCVGATVTPNHHRMFSTQHILEWKLVLELPWILHPWPRETALWYVCHS